MVTRQDSVHMLQLEGEKEDKNDEMDLWNDLTNFSLNTSRRERKIIIRKKLNEFFSRLKLCIN